MLDPMVRHPFPQGSCILVGKFESVVNEACDRGVIGEVLLIVVAAASFGNVRRGPIVTQETRERPRALLAGRIGTHNGVGEVRFKVHRVELVHCDDVKLLGAHDVAPDDPGGT